MALYADRVKDTSVSTGTGAITLANSAPTGFQTFATAFGASAITVAYCIADQTGNNWEVGTGVFNGTTGLTRVTVLGSSNSGSLVNFTSGTKDVFCTAPAKYLEPGGAYAVNSSASVALSAASAYNQFFIGGASGATLPDVTTIPLGYTVHIVNQTSSTLVVDADGTTIFVIPINTGALFTCIRVTIPQDTAWIYATSDLWSTGDGSSGGNTGITGTGRAVLQIGAAITSPTITTAPSIGIQNAGATGGLQMIRNTDVATTSTRMYLDSSSGVGAIYNGNGSIFFNTNATVGVSTGANQFRVAPTASAVNYVQVTGSTTTAGLGVATVSGQGTATDVDVALTPKAAGRVRFGSYTATLLTQTGFIEIKDSGGTTRRLLVG
jgi:hypothetical protein